MHYTKKYSRHNRQFGIFPCSLIQAQRDHKLIVFEHHASLRSNRGAPRAKTSKPVLSVQNGWVAGQHVYIRLATTF